MSKPMSQQAQQPLSAEEVLHGEYEDFCDEVSKKFEQQAT